ncbi:hypothetical protein CCACVL1_02836 [Corchorus capsularis]|uniref:Uncharacterized protein n=1 Tax=Corchorus capsularis TaxID=210143 RepID=A0A1R3K5Q1_COCAP|nr:hypothetical protein CCACVL1_02836 [Corchorus capsularis]
MSRCVIALKDMGREANHMGRQAYHMGPQLESRHATSKHMGAGDMGAEANDLGAQANHMGAQGESGCSHARAKHATMRVFTLNLLHLFPDLATFLPVLPFSWTKMPLKSADRNCPRFCAAKEREEAAGLQTYKNLLRLASCMEALDDEEDEIGEFLMILAVEEYYYRFICKQPCRVSQLSGYAFLQEILHGHDRKYYLVDSGYTNMHGFLSSYCGDRYHLRDYRGRGWQPTGPEEIFSYRHSSLRNCIKRTHKIRDLMFEEFGRDDLIIDDDESLGASTS